MKKVYSHYISLGYFCEVAQDLEKLGLRDFSSPFDWGISCFKNVIEAIDHEFEGFLDYDNLSQDITNRAYYHEDRYNFWFYHDFNKYESLDKQYQKVKDKYFRRIKKFLDSINEPTLFVKYISSEGLDPYGKSIELKWIEDNYRHVLSVLRRYNAKNDIIFIGDESVSSGIIKIYHVQRDKNDTVSRSPIYNNKELFTILSSVSFPGKRENQRRYEIKTRKKHSYVVKIKNKIIYVLQRDFLMEYVHSKTYKI